MSIHEEFQWDSGLPDHLVGTTIDAIFGYDEETQSPDRLNLDITFRDEDGEEHLFRYPVNHFTTTDDGATCEREDGTEKRFHKMSGPAQLVQSMIDNGGEGVLTARLNDGLSPRHAAFYAGLNMKMERVEYSSTIDGEDVTWERMMCEEFYGEEGSKGGSKSKGGVKKSAAKKAGAAKKTAAKSKAAAKKKTSDEGEGEDGGDAADNGAIDPDLLNLVDGIADECETHDEFLVRCTAEVEGIEDNDALLEIIADEDGDVWTRAIERAG